MVAFFPSYKSFKIKDIQSFLGDNKSYSVTLHYVFKSYYDKHSFTTIDSDPFKLESSIFSL